MRKALVRRAAVAGALRGRIATGSRLRTLLSFLIDTDRAPSTTQRQVGERIRVNQLDVALRLAPFMVITSVSVVLVVAYLFWVPGNRVYLTILLSSVMGLALPSLERCWRWRTRARPTRVGRGLIGALVAMSVAAGLLLASIPLLLFVGADPQGRLLIASTCAGLIATAMCVGVIPAAGIGFSAPIIAGSFAALAMTGEGFYVFVAVLLAIYAAFIVMTITHLSRLVTLRASSQVELERQREMTGLLLNEFEESASDWMWETDAHMRIQHPSARLSGVSGRSPAYLAGLSLDRLLRCHDDAVPQGADLLWQAVRSQAPFRNLLLPLDVPDGKRWWSLTGRPTFDSDGAFAGYRGVGSDATKEKIAAEQLAHAASHDPLTDLPNRTRFDEEVGRACRERASSGAFALLCLDLDRFKQVNDTFGHAVGDELLQQVARRLRRFETPRLSSARLAGDEFAVLARFADRRTVEILAGRMVQALSEPYALSEIQVTIGVSIGIALCEEGDAKEITARADVALYRMKQDGRNGFRFYEPVMDEQIAERRALTGDLRGAMERGEFALHYQPLVGARDGRLEGFEALLRWSHPVRGKVPPDEFIPLAEEIGMILPLGEWALMEACRFAAGWRDPLSIAVNLLTVQIRHSDLLKVVRETLAATGLDPTRLELEITESAFLEATPETCRMLQSLKDLGIRLSLDDFGTGYSSLSYLRQLPFSKVKIDRSFVRDLPEAVADKAIIRTIVELGVSLGMTLTAEGVETHAQRECLAEQGCHQFQGYLFSRPLPMEDAAILLGKRRFDLGKIRAA